MDDDFTARAIANSQRRFEKKGPSVDLPEEEDTGGAMAKFGLGGRRHSNPMSGFDDSAWYGYEGEPPRSHHHRSFRNSRFSEDFTRVRTEHLTAEDKDRLLQELLSQHNDHTHAQRKLEIEHDQVTLHNKKRFSNLGYHLMTWGGIALGSSFVSLVALIVYSVVFDKQLIDTGLVGAIIRGFTEIIRGTTSF